MSITLPPKVTPGDVIRSAYHNALVDAVATLDNRTSRTFILAVPMAGAEIPYGVKRLYVPYVPLYVSEDPSQDLGFPFPMRVKVSLFKAYILANTLNKATTITIYKNAQATTFTLSIPAGGTGLFLNDVPELIFEEGDRMTILVDTSQSTTGSIRVSGLSLAARLALEVE
jgi:hypothetical protein